MTQNIYSSVGFRGEYYHLLGGTVQLPYAFINYNPTLPFLPISNMKNFASFSLHLKHLMSRFTLSLYRVLAFHVNPFFLQLVYFMVVSVFGFVGLKILKPRTSVPPNNFDLFFTSVSASTVSSMTALEMEIFSNSQLVLMTFLMFIGGEVFTSMLGLLFSSFNLTQKTALQDRVSSTLVDHRAIPIQNASSQIELGLASLQNHRADTDFVDNEKIDKLKHRSLKYLMFVVLGCIVVLHTIGSGSVSSYISLVPSARQVLRNKGINMHTFSVFTIVSSFASCGFIPTNENMIVFKKNSGLLLLVLPFILLGNTLYPPFLKLVIWVLEKMTKREEFSYIQRNYKEMGYDHMLSGVHCWLLLATVVGLNLVQMVLFCSMEWRSENMEGLSNYERFVASLFQISNARHAGESVVDLSTLSSAILVLFVVMM